MSFVEPARVIEAHAALTVPRGAFNKDDIRLNYELAGGSLMDAGTYCVQMLRRIFAAEPSECLEAVPRRCAEGNEDIDEAMRAKWIFPNGGIGTMSTDLMKAGGYPLAWLTSKLPAIEFPVAKAKHLETIVPDTLPADQEHAMTRTVTVWNFVAPSLYHRIDVTEKHVIRIKSSGKEIKSWTNTEYLKEYGDPARDYAWTTFRYQLEEFVNKIRGRPGSGIWVDGEDSIKHIDSAYIKAGLSLRPTNHFVGA